MDYERLYKEANKKVAVRFGSNVAKELSEDEKLKKRLIQIFKSYQNPQTHINPNKWEGLKICDIIAWLEKQGEQKPVNRLKTTAGNWYACDMEVMNENMTTAFHRGEVYYCPKDGYIDVNGALFEVGTLDIFRLATKEEIPQQKQEWRGLTWKPSDLPHWKKSTLLNDNVTGFNSDYFCHKGYNINYKELFEKLPKDD